MNRGLCSRSVELGKTSKDETICKSSEKINNNRLKTQIVQKNACETTVTTRFFCLYRRRHLRRHWSLLRTVPAQHTLQHAPETGQEK